MSLSTTTVALIALGALAVAVLGGVFSVIGHLRLRRMRRAYERAFAGTDGDALVSTVARYVEETAGLRADIAAAQRRLTALSGDVARSLRHVAVVRYDAFGDMGGRLSFSAAILDDAGDGLVISAIHGRTETRTYAKGVRGGSSDQPLSPEEEQAIRFALRSVSAGPAAESPPASEPRMVDAHG